MLLEIIEEMGFDVDMAEFNRQWKRRRTALLEQWCEIAKNHYSAKDSEWIENPSKDNFIERKKARSIYSRMLSLSTIHSARGLNATSNLLIIATCFSLAISLFLIVSTVLRVTGAI